MHDALSSQLSAGCSAAMAMDAVAITRMRAIRTCFIDWGVKESNLDPDWYFCSGWDGDWLVFTL